MPVLSVRTKGNASPRGKARVYFSCHPEDFPLYFETVCADIFAAQDCAVYYDSNYDRPAEKVRDYGGEPDSLLSEMQLFVLPLTTKFLTAPCRARMSEYGFAEKHHIPILPIAMESGLENDFAEIMNRIGAGYGDLQVLSRVSNDSTEIPYEKKLKRRLDAVLIGSETEARIRAAFDAYIFLSYRKKDRAEAQKLMRLIHSIPYCQDIAIWYDEFLVPGEEWNTAIADAMAKSGLVTLAVTPNLTEPDNFIIRHEYPDAVAAGKPVVPAELIPTDRDALRRLFRDIPAPVDGSDPDAMAEALKKIALKENDKDPEHNYLIGLAYLGGIDVERDLDRAVQLITSAAEAGLPEAMKKLADMYNSGEGVERNYGTAAGWQARYAEALEKIHAQPGTLVMAYWDLGDMRSALGQIGPAKEAFERMLKYAQEEGDSRNLCVGYNRLGNVLLVSGKPGEAEKQYLQAMRLLEAEEKRTHNAQFRADLVIIYGKLTEACLAGPNPKRALMYGLAAVQAAGALMEERKTAEARRALAVSSGRYADVLARFGKQDEAEKYYRQAIELSGALAAEMRTAEVRRDLAVGYEKYVTFLFSVRKEEEAREYCRKLLELTAELLEETGTVQAYRDTAVAFVKAGDLLTNAGKPAEAEAYYRRLLAVTKELYEKTRTASARRDFSVGYSRLGRLLLSAGRLAEAEDCCRKALELHKGADTPEDRRDLAIDCTALGNVLFRAGKAQEAETLFRRALELKEALAEQTRTESARRDLAAGYDRLGDFLCDTGRRIEAREYYMKLLKLRQDAYNGTHTVRAYDELALTCMNVGNTGIRSGFQQAYRIWCELAEKFPQLPEFARKRDSMKKYI